VRSLYPSSQVLLHTSTLDSVPIPSSLQPGGVLHSIHNSTIIVHDETSSTASNDALSTYIDFISAHVFFTGLSSFSRSAALFNPNCVVHQNLKYLPRPYYFGDAVAPSALYASWNQSSGVIENYKGLRKSLQKCVGDHARKWEFRSR
jgi:hypothetical protein